jgi:hypothetical protein
MAKSKRPLEHGLNQKQRQLLEGRLRNALIKGELGPDGRLSILLQVLDKDFTSASTEVASHLKEWVDEAEAKDLLFEVCDLQLAALLESRGVDVRRFQFGPSDVPPILSSTPIWSPIPQREEIGREEALFRREDHRVPA